MKTTISVADVVRIGGCQSGLERAIQLGARVGIPADAEVEFDVVMQTCIDHDDTLLQKYFTANKARLLEYTDARFSCFVVCGQTATDIDAAKALAEKKRLSCYERHKDLTSVAFSESIGEDSRWIAIDLDTFEVPQGVVAYHFHVFNHKTGTHIEAASLEAAKQQREVLIASFLEEEKLSWQIYKRLVYAEDGVSFIDEVME